MGTVVSESSNPIHLQTVHLTYQRTSKTAKMLFIVTVLMPLALAQACPEVTMPECNDGEFPCWGGLDADGCPIPDYCIPEKTGEIGTESNGAIVELMKTDVGWETIAQLSALIPLLLLPSNVEQLSFIAGEANMKTTAFQ